MIRRHLIGALKYKMPDDLREQINDVLNNPFLGEVELKKFLKEVRERRRFTLAREAIPWFPTINKNKCNSCGICYGYCKRMVYALSQDGTVDIENPHQCILLCSGCEDKCPQRAISFPDKKDFKKYIYYE